MSDTADPNAKKHGIVLPGRVYDLLKDLDLIALPAIAASFGGIGTLYGASEELITLVVGTISFIMVLIGILLKISNVRYQSEAKVAAIQASHIVAPSISISQKDPTKLVISETVTGPGIAVDPAQVVVNGPSQ